MDHPLKLSEVDQFIDLAITALRKCKGIVIECKVTKFGDGGFVALIDSPDFNTLTEVWLPDDIFDPDCVVLTMLDISCGVKKALSSPNGISEDDIILLRVAYLLFRAYRHANRNNRK